jgi:hypothetical protein
MMYLILNKKIHTIIFLLFLLITFGLNAEENIPTKVVPMVTFVKKKAEEVNKALIEIKEIKSKIEDDNRRRDERIKKLETDVTNLRSYIEANYVKKTDPNYIKKSKFENAVRCLDGKRQAMLGWAGSATKIQTFNPMQSQNTYENRVRGSCN